MDLPPIHGFDEYIPLPPLFHSDQRDGPFETCTVCDRELLIDGVQYIVEKAVRKGETIFEFAICFDCHENLADDLSAESQRRIDAHFGERVDIVERRKALLERAPDDAYPWLETCLLTKKPRAECKEFQLFAQCDGGDLLFAYMPYMISGEGMEGLIRLLSKRTRETLDDFTGRYLGMPPDFASPPTDPRLLIL